MNEERNRGRGRERERERERGRERRQKDLCWGEDDGKDLEMVDMDR